MGHEQIIVSGFFGHGVVRFVLILIRLDGEQGIANEFAVVNASSYGAITMTGFQGSVVTESIKHRIDVVTDGDFLGLGTYLKGERV